MKILTLLLMLLVSFSVHSHPISETIDPTVILIVESKADESYHDFVLRVGRFMNGWTKYNDAEICGMISKTDEQYFVVLGTIYSQLSCTSSQIVKNTTPTGVTIHSHPYTTHNGRLRITDQTRAVEGDRVPPVHYITVNTKIFSPEDYKAGPGFLVADDSVKFQNGVGTVVKVGDLPRAGE